MSPSTNVMTSTEGTPDTLVKIVPGRNLSEQGLGQVESPRRIQGPERQAERMQ